MFRALTLVRAIDEVPLLWRYAIIEQTNLLTSTYITSGCFVTPAMTACSNAIISFAAAHKKKNWKFKLRNRELTSSHRDLSISAEKFRCKMILLEILVETDVFIFVCVCVCVCVCVRERERERQTDREREGGKWLHLWCSLLVFYLQFVAVDLEKHFGFLCRSKIQCVWWY